VLDGVKSLQEEVDQFATEFEQEQLDADCIRCEEDLLEALDNVESELNRELLSQDSASNDRDDMVGKPTDTQTQATNFVPPDQIGELSMTSAMELQSLALGAFGAKTIEEVAGAAVNNIGALQNLQIGPLQPESVIGLGIGVGIPALELATDELNMLGSGTRLALNTAALTLLANEVGDLAAGAATGSSAGTARSATVGRRSTTSSGSTTTTSTGGSGLNVGMGGEATSSTTSGLNIG
jgi:hypothetical protein